MSNTALVFIFLTCLQFYLYIKKSILIITVLIFFISGIAISLIQDFKNNIRQLNLNLTLYYNF
jgi:hypothetical protein